MYPGVCIVRCRLFTGEMELIDTPGVGRSVEIDRYILEYVTCANDVLVYTCNVMRILHQTVRFNNSTHCGVNNSPESKSVHSSCFVYF